MLLSGLQCAQHSASMDLMEKSLNCGGESERDRERDWEEGRKGQKEKKKKSGSTAMKKSESCSCACGRITTSSVLNTHKHQTKYRIFLRQYGGDNEDEGVASTSL